MDDSVKGGTDVMWIKEWIIVELLLMSDSMLTSLMQLSSKTFLHASSSITVGFLVVTSSTRQGIPPRILKVGFQCSQRRPALIFRHYHSDT